MNLTTFLDKPPELLCTRRGGSHCTQKRPQSIERGRYRTSRVIIPLHKNTKFTRKHAPIKITKLRTSGVPGSLEAAQNVSWSIQTTMLGFACCSKSANSRKPAGPFVAAIVTRVSKSSKPSDFLGW